MANAYNIAALAKARKDELTSGDVAALDYRGVAALAGVKVELNGNSPSDFFYYIVRKKVANVLWAEQLAAADVAMEAVVREKLSTAEESWFNGKVNEFLTDARVEAG